jgi:hypothetical protein
MLSDPFPELKGCLLDQAPFTADMIPRSGIEKRNIGFLL